MAAGLVPPDHEGFGAVGKGVLDGEAVEVLAAIGAVGDAAADAVRGHRPAVLDPAALVDLVDVHLGEHPGGDPEEVKNLRICQRRSFSLGPGFAGPRGRTAHPVGPNELDLSHRPSRIRRINSCLFLEWRHIRPAAIFRFFFSPASPAWMSTPHGRRVGGERFLHEDVYAFLDGIFQLARAEARIAAEHRDVARFQAVDRLAVGVESGESPLRGTSTCWDTAGRVPHRRWPAGPEKVGHGDQLDRPAGGLHGVAHRAGSAAATTDERQADRIVLCGVDVWHRNTGQGRSGREPASQPKELASRSLCTARLHTRLNHSVHRSVLLKGRGARKYAVLPPQAAGDWLIFGPPDCRAAFTRQGRKMCLSPSGRQSSSDAALAAARWV